MIPNSSLLYNKEIITLINPSAHDFSNKIALNIKYSSFIGQRKIINETYFDAWFRKNEKSKFQLGLMFHNNNQGPFIDLLNFKFIPKYEIQINENYKLSTAIGLGAINYTFQSNDKVSGGSDIATDLDVGLFLKSNKYSIGFSSISLINNTLTPIYLSYHKNTQTNLFASYLYNYNHEFEINSLLLFNYQHFINKINTDIYIEPVYKKQYKIKFLLAHFQTIGYGFAFENLNTMYGKFAFDFVFSTSLRGDYGYNSEKYELGLKYLFK